MNARTEHLSSLQHDCLQEAAQWYAALRADDAPAEVREQWATWLASDPAHAQAWARIEQVRQRLSPLGDAGQPRALLAGAEAARQATRGRRLVLRSLAAAAGSVLTGWLAWRHTPLPSQLAAWRSDHHTGTGELRELRLADGTRLWLNTATAVKIDFQDDARTVRLLGGEIFIETAKDSRRRPFHVQTDQGRLQALGTRFAVRQQDLDTQVQVFEGAVEIRNAAERVQRVPAGFAARFDARALSANAPADPAREAWTRGVIMANDISLQQWADELSRYGHAHIHVAPEVAGLKVVGVYPALDRDRALSMLEAELPVQVHRTLPWWLAIGAR